MVLKPIFKVKCSMLDLGIIRYSSKGFNNWNVKGIWWFKLNLYFILFTNDFALLPCKAKIYTTDNEKL